MKSNVDKCHLTVSTNNTVIIKIENINITSSTCEKCLRVKFDHKLTFDDCISAFCKRASRKIHALPIQIFWKKRMLMNAFIKSQFTYCLLVWMSHSHSSSSEI